MTTVICDTIHEDIVIENRLLCLATIYANQWKHSLIM